MYLIFGKWSRGSQTKPKFYNMFVWGRWSGGEVDVFARNKDKNVNIHSFIGNIHSFIYDHSIVNRLKLYLDAFFLFLMQFFVLNSTYIRGHLT